MKRWLKSNWMDAATVAVALTIAVALRLNLVDFKSVDFFNYTKEWYNTLKSEGFSAFGRDFSNYNLPYLYLLYAVVRVAPDLPSHIAVKVPSMAADFVAAFLVFRILRAMSTSKLASGTASFGVLMTPTIVLNSAFWGQADALYATALVACIYFLVRRQDHAAMALFGIALSFKVQSVFLAPLLAGLLLRRELRPAAILWIPTVFLALLLPAAIAGRPLLDLLLIYPLQAGQYQQLTLHAPSALAWIPDSGQFFKYFDGGGLVLAAVAALGLTWAIYKSEVKLTPPLLIELALISAVLIPFCLPRMHERYFFLADVLSVVVAFLIPRLLFAPLIMITVSFFAYQPTLFGIEPVPMGLLALAVLILLVGLMYDAAPRLFPSGNTRHELGTK